MYKGIFGFAILLLLIGIMIVNYINNENKSSSIIPDEQNTFLNDESTQPDLPSLAIGEKAPNFELKTIDGQTMQLSDLHGKKVILNFWATWCGPCRQEMPAMQEFYAEYGGEVEILAINATDTEKNLAAVEDFLNSFNFTYPILLDEDSSVNDAYEVLGLPTTYFIGTDGTIQAPMKLGTMTYEFMVDTIESIP